MAPESPILLTQHNPTPLSSATDDKGGIVDFVEETRLLVVLLTVT